MNTLHASSTSSYTPSMLPSVHGSTSVDWEWGNGARIVTKSLAPIHIHLSGQDVGSVASLQNTREREGGEGGREGRGGRGGGREEWNRHRESTCKCESYELRVFVCVRESNPPSLPPPSLPSSILPHFPPSLSPSLPSSLPGREGRGREGRGRGREGEEREGEEREGERRGRNGWTEAGKERL